MNTDAIRLYLQTDYTDQHLAALLAHAESGKLTYFSCCCPAGIPWATHALRSRSEPICWREHDLRAVSFQAGVVSVEFCYLGHHEDNGDVVGDELRADELRRQRIIPLVREEIARRDQARQQRERHTGRDLFVGTTITDMEDAVETVRS